MEANKTLELTPAARARVKELMEKEGNHIALQVDVDKKGCSGLAYQVRYIEELHKNDVEITPHVYVTPQAALVLYGSTMDYVEEDLYQGFKFENPNAKGTCGCGESFHV